MKTKEVVVLIGAGSIGLAIARRIGSGKTILIADYKDENLKVVSKELYNAGFENETIMINISEKGSVNELIEKALSMGNITNLIHSAGVSPSQAQINDILKVDLYFEYRYSSLFPFLYQLYGLLSRSTEYDALGVPSEFPIRMKYF